MIKSSWFGSNRGEGTFASTRRHSQSTHRRVVVLLLGGMAVCGWLYIVFGSGMFRVRTLDIQGLVALERGVVEQETFAAIDEQGMFPWKKRNLLFLDTKQLEKDLERRLYAESVTVDKSYPDILRLKIEERQAQVIVMANNDLYLISRTGVVAERIGNEDEARILQRIAKPSPTTKMDLPILTLQDGEIPEPNETFVSDLTVERWLEAFRALSEAGFGYRNAVLEHPTSTKLILDLFEPYNAYFDLMAPIQPQITSFYAFTKAMPAGTKITSYVDVRVPGKVYYK